MDWKNNNMTVPGTGIMPSVPMTAHPVGAIQSQLSMIDVSLTDLDAVSRELLEALGPILAPPEPTPAMNEKQEVHPVPLAALLAGIRDRIGHINGRLRDIRERIEL